MNENINIRTYCERARARRDELFRSPDEFRERIKAVFEEEGIGYTDYQLTTLTRLNQNTFPLIRYLPGHAKALDVSIGYLLGQHDIKELKTVKTAASPRIKECEDTYRRRNGGRSLLRDKIIQPQWSTEMAKGDKKPVTARPFIRIAEALEWDMDYVLGVSSIRSWKYFCIERDMLGALPERTLVCAEGDFGILSHARDGFIFGNGRIINGSELAQNDYFIVSKSYPL